MLFNSLEFAIFLPIVFLLYWFVFDSLLKRCKHQLFFQNFFIVIVSYVFYGWWDWRFLVLIAFTSFCSWGSGLLIQQEKRPKLWMLLNVIVNLLILSIFKYHNFFVTSFADIFGANSEGLLLKIILPVGISFYTFQAISYSIDVYRKKLPATKDIVAFFAFVSFFPQLVAGPIERATNLLPQFQKKRTFNYEEAVDGMRRILWGLFKKVVIADNCAKFVDLTWTYYNYELGGTLALAAILFAFQIYGDFSGYSDIAIGTAKLFGIHLKDNFLSPYFSRNVAEFWKRWHVSLNTWFVDYVYIPLGGSREGNWKTIRNTFILFLISGLWHGANWTFVCWGAYHALLFIPLIYTGRTKKYKGTATWRQLPQILITFALAVFGWILFRAPSLADAIGFVSCMSHGAWRASYRFFLDGSMYPMNWCIIIMILTEWFHRNRKHGLDISYISNKYLRLAIYYTLLITIVLFSGENQTFIYFQF